jgi:hypothetical protein
VTARAALLLLCAWCAACSLFFDSTEFTGGAPSTGDGGGDSSTDGASVDGPATGDVVVDGAVDGAFSSCADGGFCDSFERTDVLGAWDTSSGQGGCSPVIDQTFASNGSSSLHVNVPNTDLCVATLTKTFSGGLPARMLLSFDLRASDSFSREIDFMEFNVGSRRWYFFFGSGEFRFVEIDDGTPTLYKEYPLGNLTPTVFHHLALDYTFANRKLVIGVDGVQLVDTTGAQDYVGSTFRLKAGVHQTFAGAAVDLWFDDFRFLRE